MTRAVTKRERSSGLDGAFRFKTAYRYDAAGRLAEETQLDKDDAVRHKIVYAFDAEGHQTGYAIYDGAGALLGRTTPENAHLPRPDGAGSYASLGDCGLSLASGGKGSY